MSSCAPSTICCWAMRFYDEIFAALRIPVRAGALAGRPRRQPRGADRQERARHRADQRLPQQRPPDGGHRPTRVHGAHPPRPRHHPARPDAVGPRPAIPGRRLRRREADAAAGHPGRAARRVLPARRRRVHAHHRPRAAPLAAGTHRGQGRGPEPRGAAAHPRTAQRRRGVRDVPADEVRRAEAVQPRRRRDGHRAARRGAGPGRRRRAWTRSSSACRTAAG